MWDLLRRKHVMDTMSNKATSPLSVGTRVRVKHGVTAPEVPDICCAGWVGNIIELLGKKAQVKYIIEWDNSTIDEMPADYIDRCEEQGLYFKMSCLEREDIEAV
jgi:hypothetical protein